MGTPLLYELVDHPGTTAVIVTCLAVFVLIHMARLGYEDVGLSYEGAVLHGEVWRIVTAQLSHVETLHLLFNVSSLWSLRGVESGGLGGKAGTLYYLHTSSLLLIFSGLVCLGIYHVLIYMADREQYLHVTAVGYSCVTFGWMAVLSLQGSSSFSFLGFMKLPMWAAPFSSLLLTSVIIPRASFIGHLSGILVGYAIAFGLLDWLTPLSALTLGAWGVLLMGIRLIQQGRWQNPYIYLLPSGDVETGACVPVIAGVPDR